MTPKRERVFKKSYARELVGIAEGDLESAKALVEANHHSVQSRTRYCDIYDQLFEHSNGWKQVVDT